MPKVKQVNFALLGLGKLGLGFYKVFKQKQEQIEKEARVQLNLKKILVKNAHYKRPTSVDKSLITTNLDDLLKDDSLHVVVDAMGGIEPIFGMLKKVISRGIHIISANRTLLASKMHDITDLVNNNQVFIFPEPSLGGGVPIISTLERDLVANHVKTMIGILSGTSNFILSEMTKHQIDLKSVLKRHDILKMSESLSIIDYEGSDAAQKISILAAGAFGVDINYLQIYAKGISDVSLFDIQSADEFGFEIKLLAILKEHPETFEIHIHPTLVPKGHPLTLIQGDQNAYFLETDLMGEYMLYGKGIGVEATSSLIIRDLVSVANRIRYSGSAKSTYRINWNEKPVMPMEEIKSAYYIRFPCLDEPGVVGKITTALGRAGINLASAHAEVNKKVNPDIGYVHILVDEAQERAILKAIDDVTKMNIIKGKVKFFRILRGQNEQN